MSDQPWLKLAAVLSPSPDAETKIRVEQAFQSEPVQRQAAMLARVGRSIGGEPMLYKTLPGPFLRIFFPVTGSGPAIDRGTIIAIVLLYDVTTETTLYAHPVPAGPNANPMLRHLDGPMAAPKAQKGRNGDLATVRLLEHKRAIWDRFLEERESVGAEVASVQWTERFKWSLQRLYFCERCSACRWGTAHFDGRDGAPFRHDAAVPAPLELTENDQQLEARIVGSEAWKLEAAYALRGAFEIEPRATVLRRLDDGSAMAIFPARMEFLQVGAIVGLCAFYDGAIDDTVHVHVLHAGPEPELPLIQGTRILGLPGPANQKARTAYIAWRREAWSRFWFDELERGLHEASHRWMMGLTGALDALLSDMIPAEPAPVLAAQDH